jgi:surface carbohydrate biosynthesis protein
MQYFNYPHSSDAIELIFNDAKKLSSYEAAFSSSIIVGMDSTLLFEMLGLGKKVLFCVQSDTLLKDMRTDNFYEKMPSELLLEEMDIQALEKKMDALKNMSDKKYALLIKDAQLHYMNFQSSRPHKVIAEYIDNALQGKE